MRSFMLGTLVGGCAVAFVAYLSWPAPALTPLKVIDVPIASVHVPPPSISLVVVPPTIPIVGPAATPPPPAAPPIQQAAVPVVALSAEHTKMLQPEQKDRRPTLPELHAAFITEGRDPTWSGGMEQSINQVLAAANAAGELQIMSVECRSSMCEVLAFGNSAASSKEWNQAIGAMRKEPWYSDMGGESTTMGSQNGRFTVATIFQRKKP